MPIILLTGFLEDTRDRELRSLFDAVLIKPVENQTLLDKIADVCRTDNPARQPVEKQRQAGNAPFSETQPNAGSAVASA